MREFLGRRIELARLRTPAAARDAGVRTAILFTDDANLPARRAYAALGFEQIGRYRLLLLRQPIRRSSPPG